MASQSTEGRRLLSARLARDWSLLKILTPREFRVRYRESVLDVAWALVTPIVLMVVYGVILTRAFNATSACSPYLSSAWIGLVIWTFFSSCLTTGTYSLLLSGDLMSKIYFPREAIPLSHVGVNLIDLSVGIVTVFAVVLVQGAHLSITVLAMVPALVTAIVWTAALSLLSAVFSVFLRDISHAVQLALRAGFFATPVMYETSFLPKSLQWIAVVNPIAVAIDGIRDALLCQSWPQWGPLIIQLVVGSILLVVAVLYVRKVEDRMVDVL